MTKPSEEDVKRAEDLIEEARRIFDQASEMSSVVNATSAECSRLNAEARAMLHEAKRIYGEADALQEKSNKAMEDGERLRYAGELKLDEAAKILGLPPRRLPV